MSHIVTQMAQAAQAAQETQDAMARLNQGIPLPRPKQMRLPLSAPVRVMVMLGMNLFGAIIGWNAFGPPMVVPFMIVTFILSIFVIRMIHITAEWERGVVLRLGKFSGLRGPGLVLIFPVIDNLTVIDTRVQTIEIPRQRVITRDNIPVSVNGVLYFKVQDVGEALTKVQDYEFSILNYAMAALRDVIGRLTLDEMLAERDQIQREVQEAIDKHATEWGLKVDALRLQDIDMPEELKRMMSRQASAEREKRATITKAEGDKLAAFNLAEAATTMYASPGAMQLRTLQTLDSLGSSSSNTVVLALPDIFQALNKLGTNGVMPGPLPPSTVAVQTPSGDAAAPSA